MKEYIISIIGVAVLSGLASVLVPRGWEKYVKIITGLIVVSVITSPLARLTKVNLFSDFSTEEFEIDKNLQSKTVAEEAERRIEEDIESRVKDEFLKDAAAEVKIEVTETGGITGVTHIKVETEADREKLSKRLCEVYGTKRDEVEIIEP